MHGFTTYFLVLHELDSLGPLPLSNTNAIVDNVHFGYFLYFFLSLFFGFR